MVINVKWGLYAAAAALVLSFLTGILVGRAGFSTAILRALAFAALFFALGVGVQTLINTFMPELLFPEGKDAAANIFGTELPDSQNQDSQSYGSQVNITLGDSEPMGAASAAALPEGEGTDADKVGNIADLISGAVDPAAEAKKQKGLDEIGENSYTGMGEDIASSLKSFAEPSPTDEGGGFSMNFDTFTMGGGIAGLDAFGDSFSVPADSSGSIKQGDEILPERKVTGNKPMALEGDFSPKDIAAGIRSVLDTEKKG